MSADKHTNQVNSQLLFDLMLKYKTENNLKFQQQKYLMAGKSLLPALPDFPEAFVRKFSKVLLLTSVGTVLTASPGWAQSTPTYLAPSRVDVVSPSGTYNGTLNSANPAETRNGSSPSRAYVDDILLDRITFSGGDFQSSDIVTVQEARVTAANENVNAEFGDLDNGRDNNPNPFVSANLANEGAAISLATQESTDPNIQNPAIRASFNTLSLSQGVDGEDAANYSYNLIFQQGIVDNNSAVDQTPELVLFERGRNSDFSVQAITGGTSDSPTFSSNTISVARGNMAATGIYIDTSEIGNGQELGVVGFDLNDFGSLATINAPGNNTLYGIRVTSLNNSGADMYGQFLTAQNTSNLRPVPRQLVPFNFSPGLGILALGAWAAIAQLKSKVQKKGRLGA